MQVKCDKCGRSFGTEATSGIVKCPGCGVGLRFAPRKPGRQEMPTMLQHVPDAGPEETEEPPAKAKRVDAKCSQGHTISASGASCGVCDGKKRLKIMLLAGGGLLLLVVLFLIFKK